MNNMLSKFLSQVKRFQYELFLGSCIILIAATSYNLGQVNSLKKTPITVKDSSDLKAEIYQATETKPAKNNSIQNAKHQTQDTKSDTRVVASKNSDKYHYSYCSSAKRIKPDNQIWFNSAQEAEKRGYTLAGNCVK